MNRMHLKNAYIYMKYKKKENHYENGKNEFNGYVTIEC